VARELRSQQLVCHHFFAQGVFMTEENVDESVLDEPDFDLHIDLEQLARDLEALGPIEAYETPSHALPQPRRTKRRQKRF
jgi:hypothetical protein